MKTVGNNNADEQEMSVDESFDKATSNKKQVQPSKWKGLIQGRGSILLLLLVIIAIPTSMILFPDLFSEKTNPMLSRSDSERFPHSSDQEKKLNFHDDEEDIYRPKALSVTDLTDNSTSILCLEMAEAARIYNKSLNKDSSGVVINVAAAGSKNGGDDKEDYDEDEESLGSIGVTTSVSPIVEGNKITFGDDLSFDFSDSRCNDAILGSNWNRKLQLRTASAVTSSSKDDFELRLLKALNKGGKGRKLYVVVTSTDWTESSGAKKIRVKVRCNNAVEVNSYEENIEAFFYDSSHRLLENPKEFASDDLETCNSLDAAMANDYFKYTPWTDNKISNDWQYLVLKSTLGKNRWYEKTTWQMDFVTVRKKGSSKNMQKWGTRNSKSYCLDGTRFSNPQKTHCDGTHNCIIFGRSGTVQKLDDTHCNNLRWCEDNIGWCHPFATGSCINKMKSIPNCGGGCNFPYVGNGVSCEFCPGGSYPTKLFGKTVCTQCQTGYGSVPGGTCQACDEHLNYPLTTHYGCSNYNLTNSVVCLGDGGIYQWPGTARGNYIRPNHYVDCGGEVGDGQVKSIENDLNCEGNGSSIKIKGNGVLDCDGKTISGGYGIDLEGNGATIRNCNFKEAYRLTAQSSAVNSIIENCRIWGHEYSQVQVLADHVTIKNTIIGSEVGNIDKKSRGEGISIGNVDGLILNDVVVLNTKADGITQVYSNSEYTTNGFASCGEANYYWSGRDNISRASGSVVKESGSPFIYTSCDGDKCNILASSRRTNQCNTECDPTQW